MIALASRAPVTSGAVPYDYSFIVGLTGSVGRIQTAYVTISVEAPFVAASIGYGVLPDVSRLTFGPTLAEVIGATSAALPNASCTLANITVPMVLNAARRAVPGFDGSRMKIVLNPAVGGATALGPQTLARLFQIDGGTTAEVPFLYALFDQGTGRAFQSEPVLSLAGLGSADGDRPFRTFPAPITFGPRSTLRLEVTERSTSSGTLYVTLHGYKAAELPTAANTPRRVPRAVRR